MLGSDSRHRYLSRQGAKSQSGSVVSLRWLLKPSWRAPVISLAQAACASGRSKRACKGCCHDAQQGLARESEAEAAAGAGDHQALWRWRAWRGCVWETLINAVLVLSPKSRSRRRVANSTRNNQPMPSSSCDVFLSNVVCACGYPVHPAKTALTLPTYSALGPVRDSSR